jgi:hypothetical protein
MVSSQHRRGPWRGMIRDSLHDRRFAGNVCEPKKGNLHSRMRLHQTGKERQNLKKKGEMR